MIISKSRKPTTRRPAKVVDLGDSSIDFSGDAKSKTLLSIASNRPHC
jgi:hypothetical protein